MANSSVYEKIIEKGEQEALKIKQQGLEKANNTTEQVMQETDEKIQLMINDTKLKHEDLVKTRLAEFEQTKKQKVLANKKRIIKETFQAALNKLVNMDDDKLKQFVKNYLNKSLIKEKMIIRVNQNDQKRYIKLFSSKNNNELDLLGNITLDKEVVNISGGFIIISDYFDIDNSYEVILKNLEEELETSIASMLFGSEV